ncbi:carboxylating nicotinate-nucleotide diphosphorylase [soil metagenome]
MNLDPHTLQLIRMALAEDIGPGDVTARFFTPAGATTRASIVAKEAGSVAGSEVATEVFRQVDPGLAIDVRVADGARVEAGTTLLTASGPTRSLLTAERTALNFFARLCGVATLTCRYVDAVAGTGARILDTRKTTPGWRVLEKAAVRAGGGHNHRMGLYDRVMVKDNHLLAEAEAGALQAAINAVKAAHPDMLVELEADTLDQVRLFLDLQSVDIILLDNMTAAEMREAVSMAAGRVELEASGGVTLESVRDIAETGIDSISVGALTHSARSLDLSLTIA